MITLNEIGDISPILLTVLLIAYLILAELGSPRMKKTFLPVLIALMIVFLIIAILDIVSKWG